MIRSARFLIFAMLLASLGASGACSPQAEPGTKLYEYRELSQKAASARKNLLMVYGADWCQDCRALYEMMDQPRIKQVLDEKFVVMKIDVCRFDCNMEFARLFGNPAAGGIPALVVTDGVGKAMVSTNKGEFASARSMPETQFLAFLEKYGKQ